MERKILIFEPYCINSIYGNSRFLLHLFKLIDKARFKLVLVSPIESDFLEIIKEMGNLCLVIPATRRLRRHAGKILEDGIVGRFLTGMSVLRYTFHLLRVIQKERPDVIQCNSIRSLITIGMAGKLSRTPLVWYVKGELNDKVLDRIGFHLADDIIFQTETNKNREYPEFIRKNSKKIIIHNNGIDLDYIRRVGSKDLSHLEADLNLNREKINIIFVGQIYPLKGLNYLIKALAIIREKVPNIYLYIVGDHGLSEYMYYKDELEGIIESEKLRNSITFTGYRFNAIEILSLMEIFVLPSLSEGAPTSIMEAMALGKPVVATKVGGVVDMVRDGDTGFIVEPRDHEGLAKAIITLAKDETLRKRFGENARDIAFREFSIVTTIATLENLYTEIIQKRVSRR